MTRNARAAAWQPTAADLDELDAQDLGRDAGAQTPMVRFAT